MLETEDLLKLAERAVGPYASAIEPYLADVRSKLVYADMHIDFHQYVSAALFTALVTAAAVFPLIAVMTALGEGGVVGIVAGIVTGLFASVFLGALAFLIFYIYPTIIISQKKADINNNLPFATMYLSTIAGTGAPPSSLFDLLGDFEEYGTVSEEAGKIARDVYTFGAGTTEAIQGAARRSPSQKFEELLWGMNSILTTGGDLRAFLQEKADGYMQDYRRSLDQFTDTLSLLVEMYITLVIVGSVFLIIVSTIMSSVAQQGGTTLIIVAIQVFAVVVLLPLASIMFIVIVKGVSPLE